MNDIAQNSPKKSPKNVKAIIITMWALFALCVVAEDTSTCHHSDNIMYRNGPEQKRL